MEIVILIFSLATIFSLNVSHNTKNDHISIRNSPLITHYIVLSHKCLSIWLYLHTQQTQPKMKKTRTHISKSKFKNIYSNKTQLIKIEKKN